MLPALGGYRLARIDASLLRRWVAGLEATGLSTTTVGRAYSVCKQVLDSAVEARYLSASPAVIKGLMTIALMVSTGKNLLGFMVPRKRLVLYVDGEMARQDVQERFTELADRLQVDVDDINSSSSLPTGKTTQCHGSIRSRGSSPSKPSWTRPT